MTAIDYKTNFPLSLNKLIDKYPKNTLGELFYTFLRPKYLKGKHLTDSTDEEIYNALEKAMEDDTYLIPENVLSDEEYSNWVSQKSIN